MVDDPYVYPGTRILKNRLDIRDSDELDFAERRFSTIRARQGIPRGNFDVRHLKAIHHHLFQDIYDWPARSGRSKYPRAIASFSFGNISRRAWRMCIGGS